MISKSDIRIDVYTNSGSIIKMTMTHIPTGYNVYGEGISRFKLEALLYKKIKELIYDQSN
jgi:hypothetical protein